jgi:hypothetical protein
MSSAQVTELIINQVEMFEKWRGLVAEDLFNRGLTPERLTHMMAQQCGLEAGDLIWTGGDVHLYTNHLEQAKLQLTREPLPLPKLIIQRKPESIFDYKFEDFVIEGYQAIQASRRRSLCNSIRRRGDRVQRERDRVY